MRTLLRLVVLALAAYGAKEAWERLRGPAASQPALAGFDTPTGTDPGARYTEPGFQDVSFGQAVSRDSDLAERLVAETGGDLVRAEERFEHEATGAPTIERQSGGGE